MKRFLSLLLVFALALCFMAGCGNEDGTKTRTRTTTAVSGTTTTTKPTTTTTVVTTPPDESTDDISPAMWRVTGKNGETMYLLGTIHIGDERSLVAIDSVLPFFDECDALAVEFDIIAYQNDIETMTKDYQQFLYLDGTKIKDHLSADLYSRAVALMDEAGIYSSTLDYYNVAMWSSFVDEAARTLYSDLTGDYGIDDMLIEKAYDKNMEVLSIESGSFQMALTNSFSDELNELLIESTLEGAESYGTDIELLYSTWLSGDFEELTALTTEEDYTGLTDAQIALVKDYNYKLLDERNIGMGDKAVEYLESGKTVFYAVGAAHMMGETGLVNRLTEEGYTVERIYFTNAQ